MQWSNCLQSNPLELLLRLRSVMKESTPHALYSGYFKGCRSASNTHAPFYKASSTIAVRLAVLVRGHLCRIARRGAVDGFRTKRMCASPSDRRVPRGQKHLAALKGSRLPQPGMIRYGYFDGERSRSSLWVGCWVLSWTRHSISSPVQCCPSRMRKSMHYHILCLLVS